MADEIRPNLVGMGNYPHRLADMGDGTWAEKVLAAIAVGGTQVSASNPVPVAITSGAASLADQSVVDAMGTYWLVRDNGSTLTYLNWSTGIAGTPAAPVAPAGKLTGEQILSTRYTANSAGTGFSAGDVLAHIVILNIATSPATVVGSTWTNISQGTVVASAPAPASLAQSSSSLTISSLPPLPAGANAIGSVSVTSLPPLPAGGNAIGTVGLSGPLPGFAVAPTVNVGAMPVLPSGTNVIGAVNLDLGGSAVSPSNALPVLDAYAAPISASWSTVTTANTAATVTTNGYSTVIVTLAASSTFAGGAVAFEVFDGATWLPIKAGSVINYTTTGSTVSPAAGTATGYQLSVAGFPQFRVRLSSALSAGTLLVTAIASSAPDVSVATVGLDPSQPLPAGSNAIGSVAISSLPALAAGSNTIGTVSLSGTLPAFGATPTVNVGALPPLPAGANVIGAVNLDLGGAALSPTNPVPVVDAYTAPSATTWTNSTPANTAATFSTNGYDTVFVSLVASSNFAGGPIVFEVFDGTNWLPIKSSSIIGYATTGATIAPLANSTSGYQIAVAGFPQFRVRLSSVLTAGTLAVTVNISSATNVSVVTAGLDPAQPLPAGSNLLGSVGISSMPSLPTGANTIGSVTLAGTLPAFATAPTVNVGTLPALSAGGNVIGAVNLDIAGTAVSASNGVPVFDAYLAPSSTAWTTATAANTAATYATNGYDTVIVTLGPNAAFAGGVVVFEVYDGANWMPIKAANIMNYSTTGNTITPVAGATQGYQVPVAGFPQFRVRLASVLTAGALVVTAIISSAPDTSVCTVGLDPGAQNPVFNDNVVDGLTTNANLAAVNAALTGTMAGYAGGAFQINTIGTSTVVFEQSLDNATWNPLLVQPELAQYYAPVSSVTATGTYRFYSSAAYVRARVSAYGGTAVTVYLVQKRQAVPIMAGLTAGSQTLGFVSAGYISANNGNAANAASILSPATPGGALIRSGTTRIIGYQLQNSASTLRSVKFFNATAVTVGTTPAVFEIDIPAGATIQLPIDGGIGFATGLTWAVTGGKGLTDNTSTGLAANDVSGVVLYA